MRALEFITSHVIYNPAYTYKFQLKTTIGLLQVADILEEIYTNKDFPDLSNNNHQVKVIHPKYYKHLKRRCSSKPFGQTKNGLVSGRLACTSSKTEILNKKRIYILILSFQVNLACFFTKKT